MANIINSLLGDIAKSIDNKEEQKKSAEDVYKKTLNLVNDEQYKQMTSWTEKLKETEEDISDYEAQIKAAETSIKALNEKISNLTGELSGLTDATERQKKQEEINAATEKRNKTVDKQVGLENSLEAAKRKKNRIVTKIEGTGNKVKDVKNAYDTMKNSLLSIKDGGGIANISNTADKLMKNPYVIAAKYAVKAIEFGIGKLTEYTKVEMENLMRYMSATTTVNVNKMKAALDSWSDSVNGAYSAQSLAVESQLAALDAANSVELANLKFRNTWTNEIPVLNMLNKMEEQYMELEQQRMKLDIENAQKIVDQSSAYAKLADSYIRKQDKAVHGYQVETGLTSAQTEAFEKRMFALGDTFGKYNKTIEDALKMQTQYTEQSGRATNFSNTDYEKNFAVGRLVGEDNLMNFEAQMNLFNQSVSDSADIMYEMYNDVNRMGLSQKKVTKDVLGNLKLAQKYDFKNGTKGFIELAKWAENARFNLSSLGGALEKIQGGGLENTITTSAKLQVLGGPFSMLSDPLAMEYEAYSDPEAYAQRIQKMFSTMGTFDKETGKTSFSQVEQRQIRAASEALGISVEDAKNMARGARQKDVVKQQMTYSTLSEEDQDAIANKAQYDKETGKWYVNTLNGGPMDVGDVQKQDLDNILSGNQEEDATKYAKGTYSAVDEIEKTTKKIAAMLGESTLSNFLETSRESNKQTLDTFTNNLGEVSNAIVAYREQSLKDQAEMLGNLGNINKELIKAFDTIKEYDNYIKKRYDEMVAFLEQNKSMRKEDEQKVESAIKSKESYLKENSNKQNYDPHNDPFYLNHMLEEQSAKAEQSSNKWDWNDWLKRLLLRFGNAERSNIAVGEYNDAFVSTNNKPMMVSASNVTPIQDGSVKLAKSDPKDSAIFAKTGGPFDKLFDGIFAKINALYDMSFRQNSATSLADQRPFAHRPSMFSSPTNEYHRSIAQSMFENHLSRIFGSTFIANNRYNGNTSIVSRMPDKKEYALPGTISINELAKIASNPSYVPSNYQQSPMSMQPLDVHIHGDINLKSPTGETFNISQQIERDPMLIRKVTELIVCQLGSNANGGRSEPFHNRYSMV